MDFLIKNNVIKKVKVIADVGHKYLKIIGVRYENKQAVVFCCDKVDSSGIFLDDEINAHELVRLISSFIRTNRIRNPEISLSLPSSMTVSKIVDVRNIKEKDIDKHIKNEHYNFNRVTPITHIIDWAYLGKREENGDTIHCCLLCATPKSVVMPLLEQFTKCKIKVGLITTDFANQVYFADLFANDFEHMNKMLVDFGQQTTKIIVLLDNIPVYCREIDIGYDIIQSTIFKETGVGIPEIAARLLNGVTHDNPELETAVHLQADILYNEINRIIQMFEDDTVSISKIIWSGLCIYDVKNLIDTDGYISVDNFNLCDVDSANGSDYVISAQTMQLDGDFNGAVGMAVQTLL